MHQAELLHCPSPPPQEPLQFLRDHDGVAWGDQGEGSLGPMGWTGPLTGGQGSHDQGGLSITLMRQVSEETHGRGHPPATCSQVPVVPVEPLGEKGNQESGNRKANPSPATRLLCAFEQVHAPCWASVISAVRRTEDARSLCPAASPAVLS